MEECIKLRHEREENERKEKQREVELEKRMAEIYVEQLEEQKRLDQEKKDYIKQALKVKEDPEVVR